MSLSNFVSNSIKLDCLNSPSTDFKTIPEAGQLVTLRGRRFCVTDVCASSSSTNVVRNRQTTNHHLVKVKSVEDDDLDAELEVIWELEIDAATYEISNSHFGDREETRKLSRFGIGDGEIKIAIV